MILIYSIEQLYVMFPFVNRTTLCKNFAKLCGLVHHRKRKSQFQKIIKRHFHSLKITKKPTRKSHGFDSMYDFFYFTMVISSTICFAPEKFSITHNT